MPLSSLPKIRPYLIVGLAAFAMVCWIIAVAADMATAESNNTKVTMGVWFTCTRTGDNPATCVYNTDEKISCGESKSHFRALQAFLVLLLIIAVPTFIASVLEVLHKLALPNHRQVPGPLGIATLYVILAAFGIVFALIAFSIDFAIPDRKLCSASASFSDAPNFKYGASPIFALIAFIAMIIIVVVAVLVPGPDDESLPADKGAVGKGTPNEPAATTVVPPAKQETLAAQPRPTPA